MAEPILISIPRHTVNDDHVQILAWKAPSGTRVAKDQLICEVETSKAVLEIHAPDGGILAYTAAEGAELPVGATICTVFPAGTAAPDYYQASAPTAHPEGPRLSAVARVLAAESGIDLSSFPRGALVRQRDLVRNTDKARQSGAPPQTIAANGVRVRWEDPARRKLLEIRTLHRAREHAVRSSVMAVCNSAPLLGRLKELGLPTAGIQSAIIYEAARLLRKYPMFNAFFDNGRVGLYQQVNVGWALDGGRGLVVPVIPEADRKSLQEIAEFMDRQLEAYLEDTLAPADLVGATFTVTDLSGQGASYFDPLLLPGQSAILGIGKGPECEGRTSLHLILAFDHQVAQGKEAAQFLRNLGERLEAHSTVEPGHEFQPYCMLCHRDGKTLQRLNLVLLKSEMPEGLICSMCIAGWS